MAYWNDSKYCKRLLYSIKIWMYTFRMVRYRIWWKIFENIFINFENRIYLRLLISRSTWLNYTLRGSPYPELSKNRFFFVCFNRWNYYQRILSHNFTVHIGIVLTVEFRAVALRKLIFHRLKTLKRVF